MLRYRSPSWIVSIFIAQACYGFLLTGQAIAATPPTIPEVFARAKRCLNKKPAEVIKIMNREPDRASELWEGMPLWDYKIKRPKYMELEVNVAFDKVNGALTVVFVRLAIDDRDHITVGQCFTHSGVKPRPTRVGGECYEFVYGRDDFDFNADYSDPFAGCGYMNVTFKCPRPLRRRIDATTGAYRYVSTMTPQTVDRGQFIMVRMVAKSRTQNLRDFAGGWNSGTVYYGADAAKRTVAPNASAANNNIELDVGLVNAALSGDVEEVRSQVDGRPELLRGTDAWGRSLLHLAVYGRTTPLLDYLISKGADINAREQPPRQHSNEWDAATPLHLAARIGSIDCVRLLISKGADINAKTKSGKTALVLATKYPNINSAAIAQMLRQHGPAKQIKVSDGDIAEFISARHILVRVEPGRNEEEAKAVIDSIISEIRAGKDFATAADEYSEDPANKDPETGEKKGGDLSWFKRGQMPKEFDDAAFSLKPGEMSGPVKHKLGYSVIRVDKLGKDATPAEKAKIKDLIVASILDAGG